jgi:hypothetical protein
VTCPRSFIRRRFDLGLFSIDPRTMSVVIATELIRTTYGELVESSLALPSDPKQKPSEKALAAHLEWSGDSGRGGCPAGQRRVADRIIAALELLTP